MCMCGHCDVLIHTFNCLPVPCTMHVGIAALPAPERFCENCRQDFYQEHDSYEIEDDSGGITKAKEESGIPLSEEMVVP